MGIMIHSPCFLSDIFTLSFSRAGTDPYRYSVREVIAVVVAIIIIIIVTVLVD